VRLRLSDAALADGLMAACESVGLNVSRDNGCVVVTPAEPTPTEPPEQTRVEVLFFVRAWTLRHRGVEVDVLE
jgi:hypothetical protein